MKAESLRWLLEPADPPIRMFTLTDVLGKPSHDEEVRTIREKTRDYGPVQDLKRAQTTGGYWMPGDSCYDPKFSATVWQLMLLAEMGVQRTPWIESAIERVFRQHLMEDGSFDHEVCFTGHMLRTLLVLGYGDDPRVGRRLEWLHE